MSGKNYRVAQNFRVSLDGKTNSNLKLLKDKIQLVNNFLLFNFVLFSYNQKVISKHLTLALTYALIKSNVNLLHTTFLTIKLWRAIPKKINFFEHKIFFCGSSSCFCRHEIPFFVLHCFSCKSKFLFWALRILCHSDVFLLSRTSKI